MQWNIPIPGTLTMLFERGRYRPYGVEVLRRNTFFANSHIFIDFSAKLIDCLWTFHHLVLRILKRLASCCNLLIIEEWEWQQLTTFWQWMTAWHSLVTIVTQYSEGWQWLNDLWHLDNSIWKLDKFSDNQTATI